MRRFLPLFALAAACGGPSGSGNSGGAHPDGYADPTSAAFHGPEALADLAPCKTCHGDDLAGGSSTISCEQCHGGWRTNCTFCHGGGENATGAPPSDTHGVSDTSVVTVGAHTSHVAGSRHIASPLDCSLCHVKPSDALDPGHIDGPTGTVTFSTTAGAWDPQTNTCAVYCHGVFPGGNAKNRPVWTDVGNHQADCTSCHAKPPATGRHLSHVGRGNTCVECHINTDPTGTVILDAEVHVNGLRDVQLNKGGVWIGAERSCTDTCHQGKRYWTGGTGAHPTGWDKPGNVPFHGTDANQNLASCATGGCHGTDLKGGASGVSCEKCHSGWQTNCTFCHGTDNVNAAPPGDVSGKTATTEMSVGAHQSHVTASLGLSAPFDCSACHVKPASALSPGHIDGVAEVKFTVNAAPGFNTNDGSCGVYCHGQFDGGNTSNRPKWTSVGAGQAACKTCHGLPPSTGDHVSHMTRSPTPATCQDCHPDATGTNGNATIVAASKALHVDGNKQVALKSGSWTAASKGCSGVSCHSAPANTYQWVGGGKHPAGYQTPGNNPFHGDDANKGLASCATSGCHGTNLTGGSAGISCETCHANWKTNCTFCHGGTDNQTGAPPSTVDGATASSDLGVGTHTAHVAGRLKISKPFACASCHPVRTSALDPGHIDGTVQMNMKDPSTGLASNGSCGVYCHGNFPGGNANNKPLFTAAGGTAASCGTCHAMRPTTGDHTGHATYGIRCTGCHTAATAAGDAIADPTLHVNGQKDVVAQWGGTMTGGTCAVYCHGAFPGGNAANKPSWATPGAQPCGSCHTKTPTTGEHSAHATYGYGCNACHPDVDAAATKITQVALHPNGQNDVALLYGGSFAAGSCANYCHGNFTGGSADRPKWVNGPAMSCTSCHGAPPSTGHHRKHRGYDCSECHPDATSSSITNKSQHVNNVREVSSSMGYSGGTCRTPGCHGSERW